MLRDARMSPSVGRVAATLRGDERLQWADHVIRPKGRRAAVRCKCAVGPQFR